MCLSHLQKFHCRLVPSRKKGTTGDTITASYKSSPSRDSVVLPQGPITRARAKQFKEAVIALVQQMWDDVNARPTELTGSIFGNPCRTLLQVQFSSPSSLSAQASSHVAPHQLISSDSAHSQFHRSGPAHYQLTSLSPARV
ncbi:hypothetical protein PVK06_027180 [Gossypium arboreum]|uniref:Uncharacterized protein n=1 Tax=Gossypium arboreum TaxID=29729 RepID=A0ABR0P035_GOSAR|nr:hypothetical protein PVK06_027180 [Gossypium arboreum]